MSKSPFSWESHEVRTEDGWILTVFRITGIEVPEGDKRAPLLIWHGMGMAGIGLADWSSHFSSLGYDVWLGTSRGAWYSNSHIKDYGVDGGWESLKERWDFSWAEIGLYDVPAVLELII